MALVYILAAVGLGSVVFCLAACAAAGRADRQRESSELELAAREDEPLAEGGSADTVKEYRFHLFI